MITMIIYVITRSELNLEGEILPPHFCVRNSNAVFGRDDSEGKRVKRICEFHDERHTKNRSITDVDWSPKVHILARNLLGLIIFCSIQN